MDDQDSSAYGGSAGTQSVQRSYDPAASYGASNYDVRNAFKGRIVYELPFGHDRMFLNKRRLLDLVAGGWQVSGTLVLSSGFPFTPIISGSNNSFSQAGDWYPNQVGNPILQNHSIDEWYNPSAYTLPAPGTFGDMRRNSVYGPGLQVVNFSAGKTFLIHDGLNLEIRADTTNAFNHSNFGLPNTGLSAVGPSNDPFQGSDTSITTLVGGGRTMQLNGRLTF